MTKAKETAPEISPFSFEGNSYPPFLVNRTGNIGTTLQNPADGKPLAILGADFMWAETEPFLKHLDLKIHDERNVRDDESVRKRANVTTQNAKLFSDLVQRGYLIEFDELGEQGKPKEKDRNAMLRYAPEVQSTLIDDWLGNCAIERIFPGGSHIEGLLSAPESVFFSLKIGNYKSPAHVMVLEFDVPSPDARRSYEDGTFMAGSVQDGDKVVSNYYVRHDTKLRFAKKYFKNAEGVILGPEGQVDVDTADLYAFNPVDPDHMKMFKLMFNPNWWIRLADELAGCFNFGGK